MQVMLVISTVLFMAVVVIDTIQHRRARSQNKPFLTKR